MKAVYKKTTGMNDLITGYCPGCGHGIVQRIIGECMDELGIKDRIVGILGVGCSSPSWRFMTYDMLSGPHGRPGAAATGMKKCNPEKIVYTYQGDGDSGSIGFSETLYPAIRGDNITAIVINNTVYAMTGGQMAPTTLEGQVTTTSPKGRDVVSTGLPLHLPEIAASLPGAKFVARVSLHNTANILKTKATIKKAFENQINGVGYSMVEILSPCPSIWHMNPADCMERVEKEVMKEFPLGVFRDEK